jgi:multidrug resistance efflux pump
MRIRAILLAAAAVVLIAILIVSKNRSTPLKVSGYIEADEARVGSRVGGRVKHVSVQEGQSVKVGDVLVELDPFDLLDQKAQAEQELAARRADLARLSAGFRPEEIAQAQARRDALAARLDKARRGPRPQEITAAEARLKLAEAQLTIAQDALDRIRAAHEQGAASIDELDRASNSHRIAVADLDVRRQDLDLLKEGTRPEDIAQAQAELAEAEQQVALVQSGSRKEDIARGQASVGSAEAALAGIERRIGELTVTAPIAGAVEAVDLQPGDLVAASAPVLSLIDPAHLWVRAYVPENRLDLKVGKAVKVTVDSFAGRTFAARITFIARQAEFTPGNVQTPEERSKQVFRIKATLEEGLDVLRPGMAADVWLDGTETR